MSTMITEVYEAFISAGAPEDKAKAAAKAVAEYDSRFNRIDSDLALVKAEMVVLKWMLGVLIAITVANFAKQFF